jgi:hypothetical protein
MRYHGYMGSYLAAIEYNATHQFTHDETIGPIIGEYVAVISESRTLD